MNEIEKYFTQKNDSVGRAISEMARELKISNPLLRS